MAWVLLLLLLLATPQESSGKLGAGTRFETCWYVRDSGVPGPCVAIVGGCHGNEPAGAYAAEQIRKWPIACGKLVVIPRANPPALRAGKRFTPKTDRVLRNLNRNYADVPRGEQAPRIWAFLRRHKPDWVVDLHEGYDFWGKNPKSVGSTVIVFPDARATEAASLMVAAVNQSVSGKDRRFHRIVGPVRGSLAQAAGAYLGAHAMTLETTTRSQARSFRTRQHRVMVHRLLQHLGMTGRLVTPDLMTAPGGTRVAIYDASGTGGAGVRHILAQLGGRPGLQIERVCATDVRAGVLDQFDCIIFSGGSGSRQAYALHPDGREKVRRFVHEGGGYVGICAGAYLATSGFSWGLKILDAKTVSPRWRRGRATVKLELTKEGRAIFGKRKTVDVIYHNGPILKISDACTPLAWFRSEVAKHGSPKGIMIDSPAMVAGRFGKGRVVCISPHPEQTKTLEAFVRRAVAFVASSPSTVNR